MVDLDTSVAKAELLLGRGAHLQAVECLETVLAVDAEHLLALEKLAEVRMAMGEQDLAIETWQRACKRAREEGDEARCSAIQARITAAGGGSGAAAPEHSEPAFSEPAQQAIEIVIDLEGEAASEDTVELPVQTPETSAQSAPLSTDLDLEHSETLEEADFYFRQGLHDEARSVYERILVDDPEHPVALSRLGELSAPQPRVGLGAEVGSSEEAPQAGFQEISFQEAGVPVDLGSSKDVSLSQDAQPQTLPDVDVDAGESQDFDLEAKPGHFDEEAPAGLGAENADDDGFTSVFDAFKKGVDEALEQGDYQAHYDLGIAYKEMGLYGDAIAEFHNAMPEPERRLECLQLIGLCSLEAGDPGSAVENLEALLEEPDVQGELALSARFDLGRALVDLERLDRAREAFQAVMAADPDFRDTRARLEALEPAESEGGEEATEADFEDFDELFAEDFGEEPGNTEPDPEPEPSLDPEPPSDPSPAIAEAPPAAPAKTRKKKISFA